MRSDFEKSQIEKEQRRETNPIFTSELHTIDK